METSAARLRLLGSENMSVDSGTVEGGFYDVYWKLLKDVAYIADRSTYTVNKSRHVQK